MVVGQVFVAPLGKMNDDRIKVFAHGSEPVFVAERTLLVSYFFQDAALGELA